MGPTGASPWSFSSWERHPKVADNSLPNCIHPNRWWPSPQLILTLYNCRFLRWTLNGVLSLAFTLWSLVLLSLVRHSFTVAWKEQCSHIIRQECNCIILMQFFLTVPLCAHITLYCLTVARLDWVVLPATGILYRTPCHTDLWVKILPVPRFIPLACNLDSSFFSYCSCLQVD